ncbi:putative specificity protein s [marine gamma proteobacterium HTCC2143]|uniref:Putative specificity protein s n=1 Tax=marine gamma proteobacterium HTCC2143 TaxID=247633 RepID=A0YFV0_9GAMM|nr:putative specificity protein s [marine gamma proteobacterium HTCC2143]
MKGWIKKNIGELCDSGGGKVKTGPFGAQLHQSDYSYQGTPVVMPTDIKNGTIAQERIARVSDSHVSRLAMHQLSKGDIVYGRRGDIGRQALVKEAESGWLCGTGCLRITLGESEVIPEYLHLYLKMPEIIGWIQNQAIGATMPNLNTSILRRVPIHFPSSKATQRNIVSLSFAYDDLIENIKRRINILESMGEEIYREWFVRFRFPGHKAVEFKKGVPKDWVVGRASLFFEHVKGRSYKSEEISDTDDESMPFVTLKSFNRGGGYRSDGLKLYSGKFSSSQVVHEGDVVMAVTDMTQNREVVGRVARVPEMGRRGAVISLDVIKLVPKSVSATYLYSYIKYSGFSHFIKSFANGANVLHLKPDLVTQQVIVVPTQGLREKFEAIVDPIHEQVGLLSKEIDNLEATRDSLLPRLISGKLSVEELDIQFPPSMLIDADSSAEQGIY